MKIKCISNENYDQILTVGKIYKTPFYKGFVSITNDQGNLRGYPDYLFELIEGESIFESEYGEIKAFYEANGIKIVTTLGISFIPLAEWKALKEVI